jgi:hypothetical protein
MTRFGAGFIGGLSTPGNDAFTKILLHMDGSNGGTTFTDVNAGGVSNTWSALSDAVTTTAAAKFGPSSLNSGAGGFGISTSAKSALDPGTGDFTVDFWYNHNGQAGGLEKGICCYGNSSANPTQWAWSIDFASDKVQYQLSNGSGQTFVSGAANINSGWHHVAMVRSTGTVFGFVDGVQDTTFSWPGSLPASTGPLRVGRGITTGNASILVDEFRYSVGIARWTSNFTPPGAAYS